MIFHKPSMEGKPVLVWEISQSPPRGPPKLLWQSYGWQKGGQLALFCEQACLAHFCIKIVGLGNPIFFLEKTFICIILKYLLHYKCHTFVIYNVLWSGIYYLQITGIYFYQYYQH